MKGETQQELQEDMRGDISNVDNQGSGGWFTPRMCCYRLASSCKGLGHLSCDRCLTRWGRVWRGGGKTGSICHFAFALVLQCFGIPKYPDAVKIARKVSLFFGVRPKC